LPPPDDAPETDAPASEESVGDESAADAAAVDTAEASAPMRPAQQELSDKLVVLGDAVLESTPVFDDIVVRVRLDAWRHAAAVAKDELECDYLSFIAGIDWAPAPREGEEGSSDTSAPVQPTETTYGAAGSAGRFQVFAHVQSTRHHWGFTLKADVDEADPHVESWVSVYPGADWHERECWEMYGFVFDGHPSLRHLYLPMAFEGHPLRKDFPLLARVVKPWPGLVDVEPMPGEPAGGASAEGADAAAEAGDAS
jgi:NADH-quinone oxidoreductase subunit C